MDFRDVLKVDRWYKALFYVALVVLVWSFFNDAKGLSNPTLQLLSGGVVLYTVGEWRAERRVYKPDFLGMWSWLVKQQDAVSLFLQVTGVVLVVVAVVRIFLRC